MVLTPENNEQIIKEIQKAGFVLEFKVSRILEKHKWNVINSRYYIDDIMNVEREIDIVAYKVREIEGINYYTALVISCKKSDSHLWAFLTKLIDPDNPNISLCPLHNWTNDKILDFMLNEGSIEETILDKCKQQGCLNHIYYIDKQPFAFQQLLKSKFTLQNDKDIYNSIITLIKAVEFEKSWLEKRKKVPCFYNFNLISVFDGEMIELFYENESSCTISEISSIKYLNRHIVNNKEDFYRVQFINFDNFDTYCSSYDLLHDWNIKMYPKLINDYYKNAVLSDKYMALFEEEFVFTVLRYINNKGFSEKGRIDELYIVYEKEEKQLSLSLITHGLPPDEEKSFIQLLNENTEVEQYVSEQLIKYYKYEGAFHFDILF